MFKSKRRPIVIPQTEHARHTGILASLWGNADFEKPTLDFSSFVLGVHMHDRGYDHYDNYPIDEISEETWLETQRKGIVNTHEDPIIDILCQMQIQRILGYSTLAGAKDLIELANQYIERDLAKTPHTIDEFRRADLITYSCDSASFYFCFEVPTQLERPIYPNSTSQEPVTVTFSVDDKGIISADPWVFSVDKYEGYVVGYELEGYPERLEPVYVPFTLRK